MQPTSVVLADDDARFRSIVRSLLEDDGYQVVAEAGDASETIQETVRHQPDVVVVDLVMEGATGLSTVEELLALDAQRPVIVISSLFDPLLEIETVRLGAWYLEKVEGVEALEHAIDLAVSVSHRHWFAVCHHRGVDIEALREEYERTGLDVADVDPDPLVQVERWMQDWAAVAPNEPSAVILATADPDGHPAARTVLLRGFDRQGCTVFTSYESRKGEHLAANPYGALLFSWVPLLRQVHLRGPVERVAREESEAYFATRPRGSQLAAWASHQSSVLADRAELEARFADAAARFDGQEVPCPPYWGGYRLVPDEIELWQGRANRMHDRLRYEQVSDGWRIVRLSP